MIAYTLLYLVGLGVAGMAPWMTMALYKAAYRCDLCRDDSWPLFQCTNCGVLIKDLRPSVWGMFRARCGQCGHKIGTTRMSGRGTLASFCSNPHCAHHVATDADQIGAWHVAVIGDRSSGKSTLVFAALWQLVEDVARLHGFEISMDPQDAAVYQRHVSGFLQGAAPPPTAPTDLKAFQLRIRPKLTVETSRSLVKRTVDIKLYDFAGEIYSQDTKIAPHSFFQILDAAIFAVDPFSFPSIRECLERTNKFSPGDVQAATEPPEAVLDRFVTHMKRLILGRGRGRFSQPLAVIVTKGDVLKELGLGFEPGHATGRDWTTFEDVSTQTDRTSANVRMALDRIHSVRLFIQKVERSFTNVRWFCVSALGRSPLAQTGQPFLPLGVALPFVWTLGRTRAISPEGAAGHVWRNFRLYFWDCLRGREGGTCFLKAVVVLLLPVGVLGSALYFSSGSLLAAAGHYGRVIQAWF